MSQFGKIMVLTFALAWCSFAGKDECYSNNCFAIISGNRYLTSASKLQSDYDLGIAKQLIECKCLDDFSKYRGFRTRLKSMIAAYESSTSGCDTKLCDNLINSSNAMYNYGSASQIRSQRDYETAKRIVENCDCWTATQGAQGSYYSDLFKKMKGMVAEYDQWLIEKQKQEEIARQREEEEKRQAEELAIQKAHQDSIRRAEEPKEIAALLNQQGNIAECISRCKQYVYDFNEEPDVCSKSLPAKVKTMTPSKITSQDIAEVYFTPRTELPDWYMEGKNTGFVQIGGDVSWVSGNLAEMNMGSNINFLIRFSAPWVIREGMPFMGYGKPVGNVTYTTAMGGKRTLPCLQLVWVYRPSLDN